MAISLYDVSVATYLQILGATRRFLEKSRTHFEQTGGDLDDLVETRLYPDMAPLRFQLIAVKHHSLGALQAVRSGSFSPPPGLPDLNYGDLEKLVSETRDELKGFSREDVDALEGGEVVFQIGANRIPFTAQDFILSFSLPNFYFHATTAYDILRSKGAPIGKRDFMGRLRIKP